MGLLRVGAVAVFFAAAIICLALLCEAAIALRTLSLAIGPLFLFRKRISKSSLPWNRAKTRWARFSSPSAAGAGPYFAPSSLITEFSRCFSSSSFELSMLSSNPSPSSVGLMRSCEAFAKVLRAARLITSCDMSVWVKRVPSSTVPSS